MVAACPSVLVHHCNCVCVLVRLDCDRRYLVSIDCYLETLGDSVVEFEYDEIIVSSILQLKLPDFWLSADIFHDIRLVKPYNRSVSWEPSAADVIDFFFVVHEGGEFVEVLVTV